MSRDETLMDRLQRQGISRRAFLKFCTAMASLMALPPGMAPAIAQALGTQRRPSVIWLEFQACTGCTESLTRSHTPTLESLIFDAISLDYHHTLQVAAGDTVERIREQIIRGRPGEYLVLVDGAVPVKDGGVYSTIGGVTNLQTLRETVADAAAVICVGTCSAFGGLPQAEPNPTGALGVAALMDKELIARKPLINVSGCPPIPVVITGTIAHYVTFGNLPPLDKLGRPLNFYGETIHDRCYRRPFYDQGKFAKSFDSPGARDGWCLYELGCKGPTTYNACATVKWNQGTSFPVESGHGCVGCAEPNFWDKGSFYKPLAAGTWGSAEGLAAAAAVGVALGAGSAIVARHRQKKLTEGP